MDLHTFEAGLLGLSSKFQASKSHTVRLYLKISIIIIMKISLGPSETAQQVQVPVTVPEDQSTDFGPHVCGFSDSTHVLWHVFTQKEIKYSDFF